MISVTYMDRFSGQKGKLPHFPFHVFINEVGIGGDAMNLCKCGCGQECNKTYKQGHASRKREPKHGYYYHPLYKVWNNMTQRCYNPKRNGYEHWGGRGISVCNQWKNDPQNFIEWCISNGWKKGLEVDRIDNDGNYEPSNIRFVSHRKNNLNNRRLISTNASGFRGVSFDKKREKWYSYINIKGKMISLGLHNGKEAAVLARDDYIIENNLQKEYELQGGYI